MNDALSDAMKGAVPPGDGGMVGTEAMRTEARGDAVAATVR